MCALLAALPKFAGAVPAVPFFLRPESPFSSGQAPLKVLEDSQVTQKTNSWLLVQSGDKRHWVQASQVILGLESSRSVRLKSPSFLMKDPVEPGLALEALDQTSPLELIKVEGPWSQVRVIGTSLNGWMDTDKLTAPEDDRGMVITVVPTKLFKQASLEGASVTLLPPHSRLRVHRILEFSALVQMDQFFGYVDLRQIVSRLDFAYEVKDSSGKWRAIDHRRGPVLFLQDGSFIHFRQALSLRTRQDMAVILQDSFLPTRHRVQVVGGHLDHWVMSRLPDHGPIWWKSNIPQLVPQAISTDDILRRPVRSAAFAERKKPTEKTLALISAKGVFLTEDGKAWRKIELFNDEDYPVAISNHGPIYVGPYVSHDRGQNFEEYIRWDNLAKAIQAQSGLPPRHLKLLDLKLSGEKSDLVSLQLDTGNRKYWLQSDPSLSQWQVLSR